MLFSAPVEKNLRMIAEDGHDHVLPSIVVQIAESCTTSRCRCSTAGIGALEAAGTINGEEGQLPIVERRIDLLYVIEDMALRDKEIFPAVVVKIFQPHSPARASAGQNPQPGYQTAVAESTVALVAIEILLHAVVGDEYISEAVGIVVGEGHSQSATFFSGDSRFLAYVSKSAAAVIVIQNVAGGGKLFRRAVSVPLSAAGLAVLAVPFHIAGDEEVQFAVVVVVDKSRGYGPSARRHAGLGSY